MAIASISKHFGAAVRRRRIVAGLPQEKLAARAGLHPTYVSMVERAVRNPAFDASAIADVLQVSLSRIVERGASAFAQPQEAQPPEHTYAANNTPPEQAL